MIRGAVARVLSGTLALLLAAGPWALPAASELTPAERLAAAEEAYEDGSFETASTALRELTALDLDPKLKLEANLYLGLAEVQAGREEASLGPFGEVLRLQPDFRLDPVRYAPKLVDAFEKARAQHSGHGNEVLGITILRPEGVLTRPEKAPSAFRSRWYQKWWVLALGGVALAGGAALAFGGGDSNSYDPPLVTLAIPESAQKCSTGELYLPGDLRTRVDRLDGEAPFSFTFLLRSVTGGDMTAGTSTDDSASFFFVYPALQPLPTGGCREYTLTVRVLDGRDSVSENSRTLRVCPVCP